MRYKIIFGRYNILLNNQLISSIQIAYLTLVPIAFILSIISLYMVRNLPWDKEISNKLRIGTVVVGTVLTTTIIGSFLTWVPLLIFVILYIKKF